MARSASSTTAKTKSRRKASGRRGRVVLVRLFALVALAAALGLWVGLGLRESGRRAIAQLATERGDAPISVLAAPRVLREGEPFDADDVERELRALGYRVATGTPREPGTFRRGRGSFEIYRRRHATPQGATGSAYAEVRYGGGRVLDIEDPRGRSQRVFTLEPARLGAFRGRVLEERRPTPLDRFPPRLVEAVLAAEDARFFEHPGVDLRAIARAAWADLRGGGLLQGGSTITQQVIKNRVVGAERSFLRKAREAFLAAYVERSVGKKRLLEIYLNEIYLGQQGAVSVLGMPAASMHYFGRDVRDLGLHQMALLAGMIASPGRFDPWQRPDAARSRASWVLERMVTLGFIDEAEAEAAKNATFDLAQPGERLDPAGDVLDAVAVELARRGRAPSPGPDPIDIFTTIEIGVQAAARAALRETLVELEAERADRAPLEGAVVVLRPGTGEVAALVGGRGGERGTFHRAIAARRQPGSAFKPFVALAAFTQGMAPASVLDDEPLTVPTAQGRWSPTNVDGRYRGEVTIRQALEESLNVPFARLGLHVGPREVVRVAQRAGIEGRLPLQPSIALGTAEVSPLELAQGYATIAALGIARETTLVRTMIVDRDGAATAQPITPPLFERALPRDACWLVLDAMSGAAERGTAKALAPVLQGRTVAVKTGTSQDGRDGWIVMASGSAVVVVWVGRDDGRPARLSGPGAALRVLRRLLEKEGGSLLGPLPPAPEEIVLVHWDPERHCAARRASRGTVQEPFPAIAEIPECAPGSLWDRIFGRRERRTGREDRPPRRSGM